MLQILQHLRTGDVELATVPAPVVEPGHVLIRTTRTLVSQGTEKMLVQFASASLLQKARLQPEKVKQVMAKIRSDGLVPTVEAVFRRLEEPIPLGYCNAGRVIAIGAGVGGFAIGERVVSNGSHAEVVSVPANLVAKVPDAVSDDAAAFTVVGAIGLQGLRLARPELGETVVVVGLGLIGQLTAQLARASGCRVIGFDFDAAKVQLAAGFGVRSFQAGGELDPVRTVMAETGGVGADAVIITASSSSSAVVRESAQMSRKRGRIVLVGVVGLELNRADFYEKELTFQVSCSYGPGRYERAYEEEGLDYPVGFVRWTENRNFQAVLGALATGALKVDSLITRRVPLADYRDIYGNIDAGVASLLDYPLPESTAAGNGASAAAPAGASSSVTASTVKVSDRAFSERDGALAVVGAGNFTKMTALPALVAAGAALKTIVSSGGITGTMLAREHGIAFSTTDYTSVLADPDIRGVIIATRHNLHASQAIAALQAGKHVLVEKPLCLSVAELRQIEGALGVVSKAVTLSVGYNRRFSAHIGKMKSLLSANPGPLSIIATMNAGAIPLNHWVHDPAIGGGRLVGEACHYVDVAIYLTGSLVEAVSATSVAPDSAAILLRHEDGSTSVVNYLANGHRELSKERIEVHAQGRSLLLDNFKELRGYGFKAFSTYKTRQDKGHAKQFAAFVERVKSGGFPLIPWAELANSTRATLAIPVAIAERRWVRVEELA